VVARSRLPLAVAFATLALLLASGFVPPWELFHDEFYYWACAQRFELGYVDHPPLAPWILRLVTALVGDGVVGFRIAPALCAAGSILLTSELARRFGAGRWGQTTAALAVATGPIYLTFFSFYSVNAFELVLWAAISLAFVERIRSGNPRTWLMLGALVGVAALDKHTVGLLVAALAVGALASPPLRADLRERWLWLGVALALTVALPNLLWNAVHGWPSLSFYASRASGILPASLADALLIQIVSTNPATLLLWLPGLFFLLVSARMRRYRPLGIAFGILLVGILVSGQRRVDRIAGIYPVAFAAGAALWQQSQWRGAALLRAAIPTLVLAMGILLVPISLTVVRPAQVEAFFRALGRRPAIETADVDQWMPLTLLGRLEWRRFSREVFGMVDTLPEAQRSRAAILAPHWLYASILEYYGREREGPPVVSPHNAYFFWRGDAAGRDRVITVGIAPEVVERRFDDAQLLGRFECGYCTAWRPDLPVYLATVRGRPLVEWLTEWRTFSIGRVPALTPPPGRASAVRPGARETERVRRVDSAVPVRVARAR
jgi:hypothetical protein